MYYTPDAEQEILLSTKSNYIIKQLPYGKKIIETHKKEDLLEDACWNGAAFENIFEIIEASTAFSRINALDSFIIVETTKLRIASSKVFSINPYLFMELQHFS